MGVERKNHFMRCCRYVTDARSGINYVLSKGEREWKKKTKTKEKLKQIKTNGEYL